MKWLSMAAFFVGVAALIFMAFSGRRVSKQRLGIERERLSLSESMDAFLERRGKRQALANTLNLAGIVTEPGLFALRIVLVSAVLAILGLLFSPVFALVGLMAPVIATGVVVKSKARKRQEAFAAQLPEVLQLLITSLRSGHSLPQAFDALVAEAEEPARSEFDRMLAETRIGVEFHTAMRATAQRMASVDLEWVASAVEINWEAGGNLAEVLSNVNDTVRGRFRLRRQIRTLTAEGRISVKVLTAMPVLIFIVRTLFDGTFRDVMFHGAGPMLLAYVVVSLTIGWLVGQSDGPSEGNLRMPILFGAFIATSVLVGWLTLTVRPSAARSNLFADLAVEAKPAESGMRSLGVKLRRFVPTGLVRSMERDLSQAGHPHGIDVPKLLGIQAALIVVLVLFCLFLGQPLFALLGAVAGFLAPRFWVSNQRSKRQDAIGGAVSDTVDQLTICVASGMGFDAALNRVATTNRGPLATSSSTPSATCAPVSPRDQALRALADRTQIPEIKKLVQALIQAHRNGTPLSDTLRIQAAESRDQRKQAIEEQAAKLGTKLIFPTVLLFFPVIFVVLLAPSVATFMKSFGG